MELQIFALTLLGFSHMARSFGGDSTYFYRTGDLLDFDEEDPFFESVGKPEEISPMELRRLKLRWPREAVHGAFTLNSDAGKGMGTEVPIVEDKKSIFNAGGFDDDNTKERGSITRGLELQNLKKADTSFDTKNPFLNSKNLFNEIATPYTRRNWEPNFLRTVVE